ncbi:uncharacterized protein LOC142050727 isoform X2 [Phalacrocorax aristotelis]|uniref:uncharacterized protein LOC142050727 isoform X2 n=1 Tax=Phalacrocorax aristotelis TaxID=126867 RepID=UPI003F4CA179
MQRLVGLLGRVRERAPSSSASAPCAAGDPELREEGRGGLHSMAARGDLAQLRRCWWWKRLRINWRNAERQTPLHLACVNGHADVVRFLARKKCQLNSRDNFKKSPLMKAVEHQHEDCVAILLEHGASPNLRDGSGNTALHMAAMLPRKPLAALLLEHNAHIDAQNKLGYTPLTTAITRCHEEMVEFLLQKGADVHAQDNHKRTPLMIAALVGDLNVIQLLLRHGADISHRDQFNYTAMFYARMHPEYPSICTHLNENKASETREECSVRGAEDIAGLNSSSSGKTPHMPLGAPQLPEAGVLPVAGVEVEKDDVSPLDSETVSEGPGKASAGVQLPAANRPGVCALSIPGERGNGVLPVTGEEDETDDVNSFDVETVSEGPGKASAGVQLPAANRPGVCALSIPGERGNGNLLTD